MRGCTDLKLCLPPLDTEQAGPAPRKTFDLGRMPVCLGHCVSLGGRSLRPTKPFNLEKSASSVESPPTTPCHSSMKALFIL